MTIAIEPTASGVDRPVEYVAGEFREVLGQFASGVTVITAMDGEVPVGFTCQSFSSLSLEPPMVLFCPTRTSGTWQRIQHLGHFTVNVLEETQMRVSGTFAQRRDDRFDGASWTPGENGAPRIRGALAHIDAELTQVIAGGDHDIAIGRVVATARRTAGRPLLFFRSNYQTIAR